MRNFRDCSINWPLNTAVLYNSCLVQCTENDYESPSTKFTWNEHRETGLPDKPAKCQLDEIIMTYKDENGIFCCSFCTHPGISGVYACTQTLTHRSIPWLIHKFTDSANASKQNHTFYHFQSKMQKKCQARSIQYFSSLSYCIDSFYTLWWQLRVYIIAT